MAEEDKRPAKATAASHYKGFVAGIFSGVSKLAGESSAPLSEPQFGHPFDTIKVRLQTSPASQFSGPWQCLVLTVRNEGLRGLYKGATPPLVGWMFMDSIMLGSLTVYRRLLSEHVFVAGPVSSAVVPTSAAANPIPATAAPGNPPPPLPLLGHGVAGLLAGWTVSFVAAPVEQVKARLQVQYSAARSARFYSGPWDCASRILRHHGVRGIYHGLGATLLFRSAFGALWISYDVFSRALERLDLRALGVRRRWLGPAGAEGLEGLPVRLSTPAVNFWAGGFAAQVFWLVSYPADVVKQRIMTEPLGGGLGDGERRYDKGRWQWGQAARAVYVEGGGLKAFWRGFVPCFLRSFPANAVAIMAFEGVMRALP